MKWVEKVLVSH